MSSFEPVSRMSSATSGSAPRLGTISASPNPINLPERHLDLLGVSDLESQIQSQWHDTSSMMCLDAKFHGLEFKHICKNVQAALQSRQADGTINTSAIDNSYRFLVRDFVPYLIKEVDFYFRLLGTPGPTLGQDDLLPLYANVLARAFVGPRRIRLEIFDLMDKEASERCEQLQVRAATLAVSARTALLPPHDWAQLSGCARLGSSLSDRTRTQRRICTAADWIHEPKRRVRCGRGEPSLGAGVALASEPRSRAGADVSGKKPSRPQMCGSKMARKHCRLSAAAATSPRRSRTKCALARGGHAAGMRQGGTAVFSGTLCRRRPGQERLHGRAT
jgi:hypothetical protein